ncbi:E3 ubiquitin-protein ligase TRIM16 [Labeo rohita]|uniref:E3 ubiquitin-protein ligase TRIM16 n=1 Tax=Labeo rohita TaxID=84645 RepID=A0ABQ8MQV3_LABRO|nr:E3 ubiquitin-protein ligase TRIM16 [Labeo rohita]
MAEARISVHQNEFICPVCLDLLQDPVAIPCGHSYCKSCITDCWDQEDQMRVYSCPQCRQTFSPRPTLGKNTILAEVVEKLKKTKLPGDCYAGAGDVQCDVCTGRKYKAVKSCLVCLNSYCQTHLEQHESFFKEKRHNLTDATGRLQEMICPAAQRAENQNQLKDMQRNFHQRIQQRKKDLKQLREAVESHKHSAKTAVQDSERIFTELIHYIERFRSEVTQQIRDQEKAAVSRAEGQMKRLEQEIADLKRRDAELEKLSQTQNHIEFLQSFQSLSAPLESTDIPIIAFSSLFSFDGVRKSVCHLRDKLEDVCKEELKKISERVTSTNMIPWTRNDFLQYSHQLTLDTNTVNEFLCLSECNRVITVTDTEQPYPDHPDRFDVCQVMCKETVCGRCYWELEWSGKCVCLSVSYKSISRKGEGIECVFGVSSRRIGVYVDHCAGTLSFYNISDTMTLIHTVQTTFTQPLYPGLWVYYGSSVKLSVCITGEVEKCRKCSPEQWRRGGTRREMEGQVHVEMETWGLRQGARVEPEGQVKLRATRAGLKTSIAKQMEQETTTAEQEMTTDEQTE